MTDASDPFEAERASGSYFIPMVDMLAGVVFLLVIMLASSMLVTRPEFEQVEAMQQELARIQKQLDEARSVEQSYLEPRRRARAATEVLLRRLTEDLAAHGVEATADPDTGTLAFPTLQAVERGLSPDAAKLTSALAPALARELPCLTAASAGGERCAIYGDVRLATVAVEVPVSATTDVVQAKFGGLALLTAIATAEPGLLALSEPGGSDMLIHRVGAAGAPLRLKVDMALPALPAP